MNRATSQPLPKSEVYMLLSDYWQHIECSCDNGLTWAPINDCTIEQLARSFDEGDIYRITWQLAES